MKTTGYYLNNVKSRREYILDEWVESTIAEPENTLIESDGRKRFWKLIPELGKYLRAITLEDGETVLNAFPDRNFKPERKQL